jgi:hypothetical protein
VFLPGIGKLLDAQGNFTSADLEKRLHTQGAGFVAFMERLRGRKVA